MLAKASSTLPSDSGFKHRNLIGKIADTVNLGKDINTELRRYHAEIGVEQYGFHGHFSSYNASSGSFSWFSTNQEL